MNRAAISLFAMVLPSMARSVYRELIASSSSRILDV